MRLYSYVEILNLSVGDCISSNIIDSNLVTLYLFQGAVVMGAHTAKNIVQDFLSTMSASVHSLFAPLHHISSYKIYIVINCVVILKYYILRYLVTGIISL